MRRTRTAVFSSFVFAASCTLLAQTYSPKTIRIDAPPGTDTAEPLRIAALPANSPLTKQQIEEALGRLADTGLFSDINYTVNDTALVIKLTPAASSQSLPVHYGNFVWWQPGELEPLVEARLPIFKGRLPAAGTLTDQVEAVLVDLLHQKSIDAKVTATLLQGGPSGIAATGLTLSRPQVVIGEIHLQNGISALDAQTSKFADGLRGEDFDTGETYSSIHLSVTDIYQNGGYLDTLAAAFAEKGQFVDKAIAEEKCIISTAKSIAIYIKEILVCPRILLIHWFGDFKKFLLLVAVIRIALANEGEFDVK